MKPGYFSRYLSIGLLIIILATSVNAQFGRRRRPEPNRRPSPVSFLGLKAGKDFKNDQFEVGAQLLLPVSRFWYLAPNFDYYFAEKMDRWQFNGDVIFKPRPLSAFYLGGGVAVDYARPEGGEFATEVGGNALVGLSFGGRRLRAMQPFIQARWTFYDKHSFFTLQGGLNLALR
ncbi:hypothetical protein JW964_22410 [candidate division KSB1 bacterium]|nr:hypothetical protein [candidate division KSB1 bacterium]